MNMSNIELGKFIDNVYASLGGMNSPYAKEFERIIGGCHCVPPTEWYGDIYLTLRKVIREHGISDKETLQKAEEIINHFSKYFD